MQVFGPNDVSDKIPYMKPKVVVGLSGGVDSSATAYVLKAQGYEVVGVTLLLLETRGRVHPRSCCTIEAVQDARALAEYLGIEHHSIEARPEFIEKVIEPFVEGYLRGTTPNPCILCNRYIKFPYLFKVAHDLGAEFVATGHYARVVLDDRGPHLLRGIDKKKDQSYFLYVLRKDYLQRLLLPLGEMKKSEVQNLVRQAGLPAGHRPESVEVCFVGTSYGQFIRETVPEAVKEGPIIGPDGRILGRHKGIFNYTIGQRKGLGVAYGKPLYVVKIDPRENAVYLAEKDRLYTDRVVLEQLHLLEEPPQKVTAKIRSTMEPQPAELIIKGSEAELRFDEPQWAPAVGQAGVFYEDDLLVGGGTVVDCGIIF